MLEKYFQAAGQRIAVPAGRILRQASTIPARIWVVGMVFLMIGAIPIWKAPSRPPHLNETAAECGYYGYFWESPMVNYDGTRIAYTETTDHGIGVFICETATGKRTLLREYREGRLQPYHHRILLPWSPDGKAFAFLSDSDRKIFIYHADTGQTEPVPYDSNADFVSPTAATWLTSGSFAYMTGDQQFHLVQKQPDGHWQDFTRLLPARVIDPHDFITALSSNQVIWLHANTIWTLDVSAANAPAVLFKAATNNPALNGLNRISYSQETGRLLLSGTGQGGESLWWLNPGDSTAASPSLIKSFPTKKDAPKDAAWVNGGNGYAYINQNRTVRTLKIQTDSFAEPVELFARGSVLTFTPSANGKRLIILGVVSNEFSSSIWEYDVDLASLKCVVPCTDEPFRFARRVEPIRVSLDLPSGRKSFQLKLPPNFDRRQIRRYPLVIASQYMRAYTSAFANCGAVCAWLERSSLDPDAVENEKKDILAAYKFLTENPAVDPERVFLVGSCAETRGLIQLCTTNPTPWKGLILWSPIDLPDIQALASARRAPKILISTGSGFGGENADQRIRKYQQDASNAGLGVDVSIYGGATHELIAQMSIQERMRVTMNFLFAD